MFQARCWLALCLALGCVAQELNVLPNILTSIARHSDSYPPINLMANISEKVFNLHKIGFKFGETISVSSL